MISLCWPIHLPEVVCTKGLITSIIYLRLLYTFPPLSNCIRLSVDGCQINILDANTYIIYDRYKDYGCTKVMKPVIEIILTIFLYAS